MRFLIYQSLVFLLYCYFFLRWYGFYLSQLWQILGKGNVFCGVFLEVLVVGELELLQEGLEFVSRKILGNLFFCLQENLVLFDRRRLYLFCLVQDRDVFVQKVCGVYCYFVKCYSVLLIREIRILLGVVMVMRQVVMGIG